MSTSFEANVQSTVTANVPVAVVVNGETLDNTLTPSPEKDPSATTVETGAGVGVGTATGVGVVLLSPPQPCMTMTRAATNGSNDSDERGRFTRPGIPSIMTLLLLLGGETHRHRDQARRRVISSFRPPCRILSA